MIRKSGITLRHQSAAATIGTLKNVSNPIKKKIKVIVA
jgi:hypothetical protein